MFVMLPWMFVIHCCTLIHLGPKLSTMHACCVQAEFPNEIPSFPQNCFSLFKFLRIHNHYIHSYTTFIMLLMHDDNHDSILFSFLVHCHCISMHVYNYSVHVRNYVQYQHSATVTTLCARTL